MLDVAIYIYMEFMSFLVFQFPLDAEALLRQERETLEVFWDMEGLAQSRHH